MKISTEKYSLALFDLLQNVDDHNKANQLINNFISLVIKNNDFHQIDKIFKNFKSKWNNHFNLIEAEVKSVYPLSVETEKLILDYIKENAKASDVKLNSNLDQSVFGGVVIKYQDKIFDASLKTKLNNLKNSLLN